MKQLPKRGGVRKEHAVYRFSENLRPEVFYSNRSTVISGWLPVRMVGPQTPAPLEV